MAKAIADKHSLTREQVQSIVNDLPEMDFYGSDNDLGTFLVLLHAFTYTESATERENMLCAAETVLMPHSTATGRALDALIEGRRKALQKL